MIGRIFHELPDRLWRIVVTYSRSHLRSTYVASVLFVKLVQLIFAFALDVFFVTLDWHASKASRGRIRARSDRPETTSQQLESCYTDYTS